jgi:hypothetical protein
VSSRRQQAISVTECKQFREAYVNGRSTGQIADETGYSVTTIRRHVHGRCTHTVEGGNWGSTSVKTCPLCGEEFPDRNLPKHLTDCPAAGSTEEARP